MSGYATHDLAVAVTLAGGLGQIGFPGNIPILEQELVRAKNTFKSTVLYDENNDIIPVGVGMIIGGASLGQLLSMLQRCKPSMVWLSFGDSKEFQQWTQGIRTASPQTKVWVQVGSVTAALDVAKSSKPDALVLQGSDAGGHGHQYGASLMTLIPEMSDILKENNLEDIPLIAAGGIMDGRSAGAAMMLGAAGVVMGTRFLGAEETVLDDDIQEEVFSTVDGGEATVRSRAFDDIWGPNPWPERYDGRCLRNAIYDDLESGMDVEEARERLYHRSQDASSAIKDSTTIWAGTGVGMLKRVEKAEDIVKNILSETKALVQDMAKLVDSHEA